MTTPDPASRLQELRALEDTLRKHRSDCMTAPWRMAIWRGFRRFRAARSSPLLRRSRAAFRRPLLRRSVFAFAGVLGVLALCMGGFWLRLSMSPIELNFLSPLLASAVQDSIGQKHKVAIAGTQIERDSSGRTSVRILDMQIRDTEGAMVASAPKAEVAISGSDLIRGRLNARRVSLVGAELAIRIEEDGQVTLSTGADRAPLAVTPAIVKSGPSLAAPVPETPQQAATGRTGAERFAALVGWLDRISEMGLDGEGLGEVGLKDGVLKVDDMRTDRHFVFEHINLSLDRTRTGIRVNLNSGDETRPWRIRAAIEQTGFKRRLVQIELNRVSSKDLFLATRLGDGQFQSDVPVSGIIRAEIGVDSLPTIVEGKLMAEAGSIGDLSDPGGHVFIDRAELTLDWDHNRRNLLMPVQVLAGANRVTLAGRFDAPATPADPWRVTVTGGSVVLSDGVADSQPLVLNNILLRANLDFKRQRIDLVQGDVGGAGVRGSLNGGVDFSGGDPKLAIGLAVTPMSSAVAKKVWPVFVATKVRNWVTENLMAGDIERVDIATNAPLDTLKEHGPPIPSDGLSVDVVVRNAVIRPVTGMPPISEAEITTSIRGRHVVVTVAKGIVDLGGGRKLNVSNGVFEVPDTHPKAPPARAQFRIDGPVPVALELLQSERLRGQAAVPMDSSNSRGTMTGQVTVALPITADPPPGATQYTINLDVSGFSADNMVMGHKIEAQALKVSANNLGYQIKGDVRINGTPANLDYRKLADETEADVRVSATLDEAALAKFGFSAGSALIGSIPVKIGGRISDTSEARLAVEADLTPASIYNLLPGWNKPVGWPTKVTFTLVNAEKSTRFEDVTIDGSGSNVRGTVELDSKGELQSANFPVFALSDGDKASLRVDRAQDGVMKISMRGDVYDGRGFVKSFFGGGGEPAEKSKAKPVDMDIDVRLGAIAGHNGEALRGVDLKAARRAGHIRSFALNSKIGRDTTLIGEMRSAPQRRNVLYFETLDAGALLRFTDIYPRMQGGQMWVAMDVPTPDQAPQEGVVNLRDFNIRGEAALNRVVGAAQNDTRGVDFSRVKIDFVRSPGRIQVKEGVVRGPTVGATMDGNIDFAKNDVRMRGTFVPLYGLNNAFGQIPLFGLFLGGGANEGLVGITYEVTGPPGSPTLRVNPISAVAPGFLRKFFEFPTSRPVEPSGSEPASANIR